MFNVSFKVYLFSLSSANIIFVQCFHANNLPFIFADEFPHCEQHSKKDVTFSDVGGNYKQ